MRKCTAGKVPLLFYCLFFSLLNEIVCTHKWTRFSTATTVTIGTLTMALTCLLYLVSAFCWGSFKWPLLQETIATLSSTCNGHLFTVFNLLRLLQMGALIGPMFLSASLWGSFNEEMYCRQGSTSFLLLVFSHFWMKLFAPIFFSAQFVACKW